MTKLSHTKVKHTCARAWNLRVVSMIAWSVKFILFSNVQGPKYRCLVWNPKDDLKSACSAYCTMINFYSILDLINSKITISYRPRAINSLTESANATINITNKETQRLVRPLTLSSPLFPGDLNLTDCFTSFKARIRVKKLSMIQKIAWSIPREVASTIRLKLELSSPLHEGKSMKEAEPTVIRTS